MTYHQGPPHVEPVLTGEDAEASRRWADVHALQEEYKTFDSFLWDVVTGLMGFECTWLQRDIADFLAYGPSWKMVQAQRGQAKTTITAIYAVWCLIHDPSYRVLIISAGSGMSKEIANWIIQIIMNMEELACMRPDRTRGDRASVESFDIHYLLKGPEKSPSIACVGITSNIQGKRADLLIADDIESKKNSKTALLREDLLTLTKDFSSICSKGDIVYLGTPQSVDSVYNTLLGRGFTVRIWTGRYPTEAEEKNYMGMLAPRIIENMRKDPTLRTGGGPTGDRGKPTDEIMMTEAALTAKEIDQGKAYFQLQHMLDTKLMDEDRYPLKPGKLVFMTVPPERAPLEINWAPMQLNRVLTPSGHPVNDQMFRAGSFSDEYAPFTGTHMYVDPAGGGQNGDETAYAVTKFLASKVYLVAVGGVQGGYATPQLEQLTAIAEKWKPDQIDIEENYGKGALSNTWQPMLFKKHKCAVEDVWETGQKELRIIDTLEPVINNGRFVIEEDLIDQDWRSIQKYDAASRSTFSFFWQLSRITRDKGSLHHDDRLDAVAGSVRHWTDLLVMDEKKLVAKAKNDAYKQMVKNPLGNGRPVPGFAGAQSPNSLNRFNLRRP